MNAREAMQALLDGKTLLCDDWQWRMNERGYLEVRSASNGWCWTESDGEELMFLDQNEVGSDDTMDFAHALGQMAMGKVMGNLCTDMHYRIADGVFQNKWVSRPDAKWEPLTGDECLEEDEMMGLWYIVEDEDGTE